MLPEIYDELRSLAASYLRRERADHTLQPTALVHEVYLRMARPETGFADREHFLAIAATAMRRVLINHARDRGREKRGGSAERVTLDRLLDVLEGIQFDALELDDALTRLAALSERQARIVELRVFGGLTIPEVARVLDLGETTVKADWSFARAWLKREFFGGAGRGGVSPDHRA